MTNIICNKFDSYIQFSKNLQSKKIRIGSFNPNKLKDNEYIGISTNGKNVVYNGNLFEIRYFLTITPTEILNKLIVLTIKEHNLILDILVDFNLKINIFELKYPIFSHIKYIDNPYKNYNELQKLLKKIKKLKIQGQSLYHQLSTQYLYKIERKLRFKTNLDNYFAFAYKGGYQEVFKLKEERSNRVIIAFDFNSMYVDAMMGEFIEPKTIKYIDLQNKQTSIGNLDNGLYRVILKDVKDTFFNSFHPFKYTTLNNSYYFNLKTNDNMELILFKNEIIYYKKFFNSIEIIEGFYSKKSINHPLKNYAIDLYNQRVKYQSENNDFMNKYIKQKLITIHSSTNSKKYKVLKFKSLDLVVKYISSEYMINFPNNLSDIQKLEIIHDYKFFNIWEIEDGFKIKIRTFDCNESIYSISSQITANARLKMIQTIERFLLFDTVEICYTNTDSIHISIQKDKLNNFLLCNTDIISNKLGCLKIETMAKKGYWFDVGRYWLFDNNKVVQFKNIIFNTHYHTNEFNKTKKISFINKGKFLNYVNHAYIHLYNNFSYSKKLIQNDIDKWNYTRYNYEEINNFNVANKTFYTEVSKSKKIKIDLYNKIATVQIPHSN